MEQANNNDIEPTKLVESNNTKLAKSNLESGNAKIWKLKLP